MPPRKSANNRTRPKRWSLFVGAVELIFMIAIPHAVSAILLFRNVTYVVGTKYPLMPDIVSSFNDNNYELLRDSQFHSLALYFVLVRVSLYYIATVCFLANMVLLLGLKFGKDLAEAIRHVGGVPTLWQTLIVYPVLIFGAVVWGFFTSDTLGVRSVSVLIGSLADGWWWLFWPMAVAMGVLSVPLFLSTVVLLIQNKGAGE